MRITKRITGIIFVLMFLLALFPACNKSTDKRSETFQYASFKDIPGITEDEIRAIEALQKQSDSRGPLIYGTPLSTEAFMDEEGELGGFAVLLCDWLTSLFGIPFKTESYVLSDVLAKLKTGDISFSALTATEERLKTYYMTAPIIHRSTRVMRIKGRPSPSEIILSRPVRYVFTEGSTLIDSVTAVLEPGSYEAAVARNHEIAYHMLSTEEADAFISINTAEAAFDPYGGVVTEDFLPLIVNAVSLTAEDPALAPIISVVTKALNSGAYIHLTALYRQGYRDYKKNKFLTQLSEEERTYVRNTPVIPFATQFMSYPVSFYNTSERIWDGIVFDVMDEIEKLTGFTFKLVNDQTMDLPELIKLLEDGTAYTMPNLIQSDERRKRFIWPNAMYQSDRFALLSKRSYPNIEMNDIPFARVGYAKGSAFGDLFKNWFPDALYAVEYPGTDDAFFALERGEVDLVMSSQSRLTALTNYYEFSDYKANFLFDFAFDASFGFNKNQTILCSIVDKALPLINTSRIVEQWMSRTYNIETMRLRTQLPPLIGASVLFLCVLALVAVLLIRSIHTGKELEKLIGKQTHDLALQTATLTTLLDSIPDLIFCKDMDMRFMQCNKSILEHFNRRKEDVIGKDNVDGFGMPAEIAEEYSELDRKIINEGQLSVIEERIPRFDGTNPLYETIKLPLMLDGAAIGILGISRDITKRKEMEKKLALRTATLTTLLDSIPDLIFTMDTSLRFTQCNKSFLEYFGFSRENIVNKGEDDLRLSTEWAEGHNNWNREVIEEGRVIAKEEHIPRIDGATLLYETVKAPLVLDGKVIGLLAIARDITMRKEMEKKLALRTATLSTLLDTIPDLIFSKNLDLHFMECNKSFLEHFGVSKEGIVGKDDVDGIMVPVETAGKFNEMDWKVINECQPHMVEEHIPRIDGTNPLYETIKTPLIMDGAVIGVLGIARDITKRKEMEAAALAASHSKTAFLANMSHEIRTPMNSIVGFSELAMDGDISPKTRDYLSKILENAEWLLQIINDLLDISKIEAGKMELEHIPFDLHELFTTCRTIIMPKALEKGIMLHFYAEPSVGKRLMGDPTRLRQVLINILSNAVKFTNSGTVKVFAEIMDKSEKTITGNETITMHFEIKDSGIGLTKEQIDKIFEPFMQAETGTTRKYGGTGLGLSITKNIIELMGGTLSVESMPGVGSKFSFDLTFDTIDVAVDDMFEQKIVFDKFEKPEFEGEVLLCEDNTMNQYVICEHLSRVGLKTVVADNGSIGVDMVRERTFGGRKQFDLIFMDMHMPVMDGLEATAKILDMNVNIPIIAMTANIMSSDLETYQKSGLNDFVGKPFTSQELWRCLLKYLKPVNNKTNLQAGSLQAGSRPEAAGQPETGSRPETDLPKAEPPKAGPLEADLNFQKAIQLAFVKGNRKKFAEIAKALEAGDIPLAYRLAHTLKSNAGQVGKPQLQKAAADVEYQLKDGKNLATRQQIDLLETELNAALVDITAELGGLADELFHTEPKVQNELLNEEARRELIEKLQLLLQSGNPECLHLVNKLHVLPGSETLIQQIKDFDFDMAAATLAELKKTWA